VRPAGDSWDLRIKKAIRVAITRPQYPSIRKLPLPRVQWADLYRRIRIQEIVYEVLTQQYEAAKIQEAKGIPTLRVLDRAAVPEKKSFPPRLLIILLGTVTACFFAITWETSIALWHSIHPADSRKRLAMEIVSELSENGASLHSMLRSTRSITANR
jgi:hypothetical protein